ncbi:dihydroorotate dehydrogenase [Methyloceanibacter methanicus]|uniref:Dihydroorotate dehydrogenase (quinone) n=1 Tax=Methyloceanibacter methanicus TaxID=1774968 RepID=A0A1E3W2S3_9HYPH|nr:quinone-dependent dihydroorotate dehydrogenase [Methyloceanibacter methanicus]ODS00064.1 dihydroorotate dehydrogenase [Methyloceanibacter methanicus]
MNPLFGLGQSLLLALDPERAHNLTIKTLELGLYPRCLVPDDARLRQTLCGLEFPNPVGIAPGFDKDAKVAAALLDMGFGFVEVGTLTPRPQPGNEAPRVFRSVEDRAVVNRLGFNNEGQAAALDRLQKGVPGIVGVNLGANKTSEDRIADYVEGVARMAPVASYLTVNISSPNTPGLRDLQAPKELAALLTKVEEARRALPGTRPPLFVKLAPDLADAALPEIVGIIQGSGADGIIVSNTTLARDGLTDRTLIAEPGGLSGRPLFARSTRMLAKVYKLTAGTMPLIGVGGIDSADAALAKIEAGASLVQMYTGLIFEGPDLIARIKRRLVQAVSEAHANSLAPLIGRRAEEWALKELQENAV